MNKLFFVVLSLFSIAHAASENVKFVIDQINNTTNKTLIGIDHNKKQYTILPGNNQANFSMPLRKVFGNLASSFEIYGHDNNAHLSLNFNLIDNSKYDDKSFVSLLNRQDASGAAISNHFFNRTKNATNEEYHISLTLSGDNLEDSKISKLVIR
ncbi:hypothetical protein Noda2021_08320 [Candidatus Dependentiae bacterium Noda2021]|nr:hypothetical protein Noda2021_08320 [Candidatus Dependentiae bacterium Noda2021]